MAKMRRSSLLGRERELVALTDMMDDATKESCVLISCGEAGVRRSSLIMKGAAHVVAVDRT
jgi:hypothetical protein